MTSPTPETTSRAAVGENSRFSLQLLPLAFTHLSGEPSRAGFKLFPNCLDFHNPSHSAAQEHAQPGCPAHTWSPGISSQSWIRPSLWIRASNSVIQKLPNLLYHECEDLILVCADLVWWRVRAGVLASERTSFKLNDLLNDLFRHRYWCSFYFCPQLPALWNSLFRLHVCRRIRNFSSSIFWCDL